MSYKKILLGITAALITINCFRQMETGENPVSFSLSDSKARELNLPEVPSAVEMVTNGYNLQEMDEILLKKVEELTLYLLEMKKENEKLEELERKEAVG